MDFTLRTRGLATALAVASLLLTLSAIAIAAALLTWWGAALLIQF